MRLATRPRIYRHPSHRNCRCGSKLAVLSCMDGKVHIGTSGWHYKHWLGDFYPAKMKPSEMFAFYAEHFDTVEINNTFYGLPGEQTVDSWREDSPSNFCFAVKA